MDYERLLNLGAFLASFDDPNTYPPRQTTASLQAGSSQQTVHAKRKGQGGENFERRNRRLRGRSRIGDGAFANEQLLVRTERGIQTASNNRTFPLQNSIAVTPLSLKRGQRHLMDKAS